MSQMFIRDQIQSIANEGIRRRGFESMSAQAKTVSGNFLVVGAGESRYDLLFPVLFTDMPAFTYGVRLPADERVIEGQMPVVTALMFNWIIEERPGSGNRLHKGCTLGVVAQGPPGMKAIIDWSLTGVCIPRAHLGS